MIAQRFHPGPGRATGPATDPGAARTLLVMLPGAGIDAAAFAARGMIATLHARAPLVDVLAAEPDLDLYLDDDVAGTLHRAVIAPARAADRRHLWLLGISLGGMGALQYAAAHPDEVDGLILIAPFLGTQGTVAEIAAGGGLAAWPPPDTVATVGERRMLAWLRDHLASTAARPELHLGYGTADRFARGHRLLADCLPASRVVTAEGGHGWETWLALWERLLDAAPFAAANWTAAGAGGYHRPGARK